MALDQSNVSGAVAVKQSCIFILILILQCERIDSSLQFFYDSLSKLVCFQISCINVNYENSKIYLK